VEGKKNRQTLCFLVIGFEVELQLDWQKQKGGVRRALFLTSKQATLTQTLLIQNGAREDCREMKIYLRVWPEDEGGLAWVDSHLKQRTVVAVTVAIVMVCVHACVLACGWMTVGRG
jgi:hypothetical protein